MTCVLYLVLFYGVRILDIFFDLTAPVYIVKLRHGRSLSLFQLGKNSTALKRNMKVSKLIFLIL